MERRLAVAVFVLTAAVIAWGLGDRLDFNIDEGIYLDGGWRVFQGDALYRDLFTHTGPGSYWLPAAALRLFGVSYAAARSVVAFDLALIATGIFWLVSRLSGTRFAMGVTALYLLLQGRDFSTVALNHRWDSSALGFAGVALGFEALRTGSNRWSAAAGAAATAGAWCTPPLGLVFLATGGWMLRSSRRLLAGLLGGATVVSLACVALLALKESLMPMLEHFVWTTSNYSGANRVPFGWAGTGYLEAARGLDPVGQALMLPVLAWAFLPLWLPAACYLGWGARLMIGRAAQPGPVAYLMVCSAALVAATYPRWDLAHLAHVAPVFYVLAGVLTYECLPPKGVVALSALLAALLALLWFPVITGKPRHAVQTAGGDVRPSPEDAEFVRAVVAWARPRETMFVFPYLPTLYFLAQARNPTRFSYIQPGLMTDEDEQEALRELQSNPPRRILYSRVTPEMILRHWPSSDPQRLRMHRLESFFSTRYHPVRSLSNHLGDFTFLELN